MSLAVVVVVAAVSMLANALPGLASDLRASQSQQQWIVDSYAVVLAAFLLPAGALGDRYGRRAALLVGIALFGGAAGLAASVADTPAQLIGLRAAMGMGAALLMPGTLATITSVFPEEERARAVGIWAGFAGVGGNLGLLASGGLLRSHSWRAVFLLTSVVSALLVVAVAAFVPSTRGEREAPLDLGGAVLSSLGIGALVLGIIEGPEQGWSSPLTVVALVAGVGLLVGFVRRSLRVDEPLLDPRYFRHRGFATGTVSLFLQFFAMFGFFFVALQYLQLVLHHDAMGSALALLPMAVVMIPLSAVSGSLSERYGHRLVGGTGLALSAAGFVAFAFLGPHSGSLQFLAVTLVIGAGAPLAMTPATTAIVASLPSDKQGVASAVNDTARELGAAFGVAVLGSAFNSGYRSAIADHLGGLSAPLAAQAKEAPAIALALARQASDGPALADAAREAFTTGMRYSVGVGAALLVAGAVYVWLRGASGSGSEAAISDEAFVADLDETMGAEVTEAGPFALDPI
jgi:EmrB/QacA subfamily drug resistance transporter